MRLAAILFTLSIALCGAAQAADPQNVGAVGQIVPGGGIVDISGSPGALVKTVAVKAGDTVKAGTLLMTVEDDSLKAGHDLAAAQLVNTKKQAAQQVASQQLAVRLAQQRLKQANDDLRTYRALGADSTSAKGLSDAQGAATQAQISLQIEQAKLQIAATQAQSDIDTAQRQVKVASAAEELRAPVDGTILKIGAQPGERLTNEPAIRMADLRTMYVLCQVYQGDLLKLRPGLRATIKNAIFAKPLSGTVQEIGRLIDAKSRLGDVRIRLDNPDPANRLVGMEVEVVIAR